MTSAIGTALLLEVCTVAPSGTQAFLSYLAQIF